MMSSLYLLAEPAAVNAFAAGYELGTGRLVPTVAAAVGLLSVLLGGRALVRSGRIGGGEGTRRGAAIALLVGLVGAGVSGLHAATVAGGLGTGNGLAGAVIGLLLGVIGMALGVLVLTRSSAHAQGADRP